MGRKDRVQRDGKSSQVTQVTEDRNTTTGRSFPVRLTINEQNQLEEVAEKLRALLPNKKISKAGVIRAFLYLDDDTSLKKLARSYCEKL
ncbi:hypothetical protein [Vibrio sp. 10N.261.46.A3]|uniref:hypothetical protein n=1 Tax=Vibrio sp. 10N.261.46.A3 TaxID=3229658 RepID=UPI003550600C